MSPLRTTLAGTGPDSAARPRPLEGLSLGVDGRPFSGPHTGYAMYLRALLPPLLAAGARVTLVSDRPMDGAPDVIAQCEQAVIGEAGGPLRWEQINLRRHLDGAGYDFYLASRNFGLPLLYRGPTTLLVTIHDLIPWLLPKMYFLRKPRFTVVYLVSLFIALRKARAILTVSAASRRDIARLAPRKEIYANWIRLPESQPPGGGVGVVGGRYFVYVGGLDPRKGNDLLLEAFARFRARGGGEKLVLIGRGYEPLQPLIETLGLRDAVVITGYVNDDTRTALLAGAVALVYPSLYEGYGLPIAEALQVGVRAITGRGGSLPEIGGDAAEYLEPITVEGLASRRASRTRRSTSARARRSRDFPVRKSTVRSWPCLPSWPRNGPRASSGKPDPSMRILYVSHNPPVPLHNGGAQRTHLIHRALRAIGEVDLVIVSTDPVTNREELRRDWGLAGDFLWTRPGHRAPFRWFLKLKPELVHRVAQTLTPRAWDYYPDPAIEGRVRALVAERRYDVVVGRYLRPTMKSGAVGSGPLCVLDVDDLDTQVFLSRLNVPGRPQWEQAVNRWHYRQLKKVVPEHLRKFDLVWVTNEEEGNAGEELRAVPNKAYLPNIPVQVADEPVNVDAPLPALPPADAAPVVLFVGNFWVLPNKMGVDHFVHQVWPKIHAAEPRAVFRIVGAGLGDDLKAKWSQVAGVDPVGFVPDLRAGYAECRFAIVPLLSGAGTNIKVMEALRFGRTCVLTQYSYRGYGTTLLDREALLVAENDEAFANACVELLRDPALADRLARQGRSAVARHYSFERFSRTVAESIGALLARRGVGSKTLAPEGVGVT